MVSKWSLEKGGGEEGRHIPPAAAPLALQSRYSADFWIEIQWHTYPPQPPLLPALLRRSKGMIEMDGDKKEEVRVARLL